MALEKEFKFKFNDFNILHLKLKNINATFISRQLEFNELWDTPDFSLKQSQRVLRLRTNEFDNNQKQYILTFKKKSVQNDASLKIQDEYETKIEDIQSTREILRGLGYKPTLCYHKLREEWEVQYTLDNNAPDFLTGLCHLDYLPIGFYLEIEAEYPHKIANILNLNSKHSLIKSYPVLFKENGFTQDCVFENSELQNIRNTLTQNTIY